MSHEQLSLPMPPTIKRPETIEDARGLILDLFWLLPYGRGLCLLGEHAQKFKDFLKNSSLGRFCNPHKYETVLLIELAAPMSVLLDGPIIWNIVIDETEWHFSLQDGNPEIKLRYLWRGREDASPTDWGELEKFGPISPKEKLNLCFTSLEIAQKAVELDNEQRDAQLIGNNDNIKLVRWKEGIRGWGKANVIHDPRPR